MTQQLIIKALKVTTQIVLKYWFQERPKKSLLSTWTWTRKTRWREIVKFNFVFCLKQWDKICAKFCHFYEILRVYLLFYIILIFHCHFFIVVNDEQIIQQSCHTGWKSFNPIFFLNLLIPQGGHSSYNCHYQSFPINELPKPGLFLPFLLNFWQKRNRDEGIQTENFWYPINLLHYLCHSPHLIFLTINESISNLLGLLWPRRKQGSRAGLLADYAQSFQELQFLWTKITQKKPAAGETFLATCFLNGPFQASFFFFLYFCRFNSKYVHYKIPKDCLHSMSKV